MQLTFKDRVIWVTRYTPTEVRLAISVEGELDRVVYLDQADVRVLSTALLETAKGLRK